VPARALSLLFAALLVVTAGVLVAR
jgi:hypothetical protein